MILRAPGPFKFDVRRREVDLGRTQWINREERNVPHAVLSGGDHLAGRVIRNKLQQGTDRFATSRDRSTVIRWNSPISASHGVVGHENEPVGRIHRDVHGVLSLGLGGHPVDKRQRTGRGIN